MKIWRFSAIVQPAVNNTLSDSTKIPLRSALPVIASVLAATIWITTKISDIATEQKLAASSQEHMRESVADLKMGLQEVRLTVTNDRWTRSDMERYVRRFKEKNPEVSVPDVE